nr:hypothetical protein [Flavobacterium sp.]
MKNLLLIIAIGIFSNSFAQGCSDAGICSIGNGFQTTDKELKNGIEIGSIFGAGEADVTYISP